MKKNLSYHLPVTTYGGTMKQLLLGLFLMFIGFSADAKELKGVTMPDEIKVNDATLKLNGLGVRKALGMFEVYVAGLYVGSPSNDPEAILKTTTPKRIVMHFKRYLEKDKLKDAWDEGFRKNAEKTYAYRPDLNKLKDIMSNMKVDEEIILTFFSDHADIQVKDKAPETIQGADFSKTLLKVFLNDPPDEDLKKGLLGK